MHGVEDEKAREEKKKVMSIELGTADEAELQSLASLISEPMPQRIFMILWTCTEGPLKVSCFFCLLMYGRGITVCLWCIVYLKTCGEPKCQCAPFPKAALPWLNHRVLPFPLRYVRLGRTFREREKLAATPMGTRPSRTLVSAVSANQSGASGF